MPVHHTSLFGRFSGVVAAAVLGSAIALVGTVALAQELEQEQEDPAPPAETVRVIDEVVVTAGPKSGDPVDLDALYEEEMRDRLMRDQEFLRNVEADDEWRKSVSTTVEGPGRMQWGYSPEDERRMQREADRFDHTQGETVKPATVFRVGF